MRKLILLLIPVLMVCSGCKTSSNGQTPVLKTYTLTVSLGDGINGSPTTGTYTYTEGDTVSYDYSLKNGYKDLTVTINQVATTVSGSFIINRDTRLTASHFRHLQNILQIRTPANFKEPGDIRWFLDMISDYDIYGIEMTVKQDEDDEVFSGHVFFRSSIAPIADGYADFDALQVMIEEAHKRGLKVFAWIPQFHDKAAMEKNPGWQMKALVDGSIVPYTGKSKKRPVYFVNPTEESLKDYQLSIINEVAANYDVDGIYIDWVRFDNYNMDMNDSTRQRYSGISGIDPFTIDFSTDNEQRRQWNDWRQAVIADFIGKGKNRVSTMNPGIPFGVHVLPPSFAEVGQDMSEFASSTEYLSVLAYWDDWGFTRSWTWDTLLLNSVALAAENKLIPDLDTDWSQNDTAEVVKNIKTYFPRIGKVMWFRYSNWRRRDLDKIRAVNPTI